MSISININNLTLCHVGSGGMSMATTPDVCLTPSPSGLVALPYPNVAVSRDLARGTTTVTADGGNMCANHGSEFSRSTGDEPGTGGGIASGTFTKEATWITYSFDVKLEGKGACRLTDKMFHNHQNAANLGGLVQKRLVRAGAQDCKSLAAQAQEGDIVLRSTPGADSDLIRKLARCDYSHSGIVTKNAAGQMVVVDAYPGRSAGAVGEESVEDFFCHKDHGPPDKGMVARPNDPAISKQAADWARLQLSDPAYKFDIASDFRDTAKDVYCSDFVYQAFQNGGTDLVPNPMDFMSPTSKQNTLDGLRDYVKDTGGVKEKWGTKLASNSKIESEAKKKFTNFEYITPCQVADNAHVKPVATFP